MRYTFDGGRPDSCKLTDDKTAAAADDNSRYIAVDRIPDAIVATSFFNPQDAARFVPEKLATRMVMSYGAIGRCSCSECGWGVEVSDAYCRECGARFIGTEYEKVGSK